MQFILIFVWEINNNFSLTMLKKHFQGIQYQENTQKFIEYDG